MGEFWRRAATVLGFDVRPRCVAVEAGEPCPWLGSVVVRVDLPEDFGPRFAVRLCHQHAAVYRRTIKAAVLAGAREAARLERRR